MRSVLLRALRRWLPVLALTALPIAVALTVLAAGDAAEAQESGGSFGGGDWGSGGGGGGGSDDWGGGGGSDWGGGGSDWGGSYGGGGYPTSYGGGYSGGGGGIGCGGFCCLAIIVLIVLGVALANARRAQRLGANLGGMPMGGMPVGGMPGGYAGPNAMYVTQLSLALDWHARAQLQQHLEQLARTGNTQTPEGRAHLLSETVLALRRHEISWLYASYADRGGNAPQQAQQVFQQLATEARSRFRSEVVRSAGGQVTGTAAPEMRARAEEGGGTVVVSLILATRRPLAGFMAPDAAQVRGALQDRAAILPQQLVALEVVWSPAAENDRMSTAELEQIYTDLKLIDPNSIAGRIFCAYCNGPFPGELLQCPHCGAPAEASKNRRSHKA
jgi:uncharacterized membrane protein